MKVESCVLVRKSLRRLESSTKSTYMRALNTFFNDIDMSPEDFVKLDPWEIEDKVEDWIEESIRRGRTPAYLRIVVSALKRLLKAAGVRGVELEVKGLKTRRVNLDYIPSTEEVNLLIERANLNLKLAIALIAWAGMRPVDVCKLRFANVMDEVVWDDYEQRFKPKRIPLKIVICQSKTKEWYCTFLGHKGARILCNYLTYLKRSKGVELKPETKLLPYSYTESLSSVIDRLIRTEFKKHPEAFKRFRTYSLRKYFRSKVSVLGEDAAEYLMGHVRGLHSLSATYNGLRDLDREAIERLREQYAKVMIELEGEVPKNQIQTVVSSEVERLRERIEMLEAFIRKILPDLTREDIELLWRIKAEKMKREYRELLEQEQQELAQLTPLVMSKR